MFEDTNDQAEKDPAVVGSQTVEPQPEQPDSEQAVLDAEQGLPETALPDAAQVSTEAGPEQDTEAAQQKLTPIQGHILELEILCEAGAAMLNGLVNAVKSTKMDSPSRQIVLQNIMGAQNDYFQKRIELAGYRMLEHFEGDLNATLRTLDQLVAQATSNITLVSADGFDKGTGRKII